MSNNEGINLRLQKALENFEDRTKINKGTQKAKDAKHPKTEVSRHKTSRKMREYKLNQADHMWYFTYIDLSNSEAIFSSEDKKNDISALESSLIIKYLIMHCGALPALNTKIG